VVGNYVSGAKPRNDHDDINGVNNGVIVIAVMPSLALYHAEHAGSRRRRSKSVTPRQPLNMVRPAGL